MNKIIYPLNSQVVTQSPIQTLATWRRYDTGDQNQMVQYQSRQSLPSEEVNKVGVQHDPQALLIEERTVRFSCALQDVLTGLSVGRARREGM